MAAPDAAPTASTQRSGAARANGRASMTVADGSIAAAAAAQVRVTAAEHVAGATIAAALRRKFTMSRDHRCCLE